MKKELFNKITLFLRNEVAWEYELRMGPETSLVLYNNVVSNLFLISPTAEVSFLSSTLVFLSKKKKNRLCAYSFQPKMLNI